LGFASFVSEAPAYSLFNREVEGDVLAFCRAYGLGVVCYSPLGGGWLSGKYRRDQPMPADSRFARRGTLVDPAEHERAYDVLEALESIAQAKQLSLSQLALAWLLAQPGVTAANFGPRTPDQLREDLGALEVELTDEDLAAIDEVVPPGSQVLSRVPAPGGIVIADPIPPSGMTSTPR
jgi:aryl-alcohol dehydrogenase-like predicted oxidoreductase